MTSRLKRMTSFNYHQEEKLIVDEICHLSVEAQAELLADNFSLVSNQYNELKNDDISVPDIEASTVPSFTPQSVLPYLSTIHVNKSNIKGDIPAKFIKMLSSFICKPFAHILNTMLKNGDWRVSIHLEA